MSRVVVNLTESEWKSLLGIVDVKNKGVVVANSRMVKRTFWEFFMSGLCRGDFLFVVGLLSSIALIPVLAVLISWWMLIGEVFSILLGCYSFYVDELNTPMRLDAHESIQQRATP